jgi:SAM-dependent methyltransferase
MKKKCRICNNDLISILNFKKVALSGSFIKKNQIKKEKKYPLSIASCTKCKHLQIQNIVNPKKLFNHYEWETSVSKSNFELISSLLKMLKKKFQISKKSKVFEIASNDGTLLKEVKNKYKSFVLGIDPAKNLKNISKRNNINTVVDFFSYNKSVKIKKSYGAFDFCIARNVIAHTPKPNDIFKGVNNLLNNSGIFIIEVPHLESIFKDNQYDNIFHEHVGFHSLKSISDLCFKNNLKIIDVEKIDSQGGSIRCYISKKNYKIKINKKVQSLLVKEKKLGLFKLDTWTNLFPKKINKHKKQLYDYLKKLKDNKCNISAYGASGKGQSLLQICNIGSNFLDNIYDKSKLKQGKYTPGTHLKIIDPKYIKEKKIDYLLLLSWNLAKEISKQEKSFLKNDGKIIVPFPTPREFK